MAQETLTVRMNRSNAAIPWGFTLRASGSDIIVNTVESGSLAEKAAISPNDKVIQFADCKQSNLTLSQANKIMNQPKLELKFMLSRYITSHPSLPWNLTDQENKIVVDQVNPPTFKSINNSYKSTKTYKESTNSSDGTESSLPRPVALGYGPLPFKSPTCTKVYDERFANDQNNLQNQQYTSSSSFMKKTTFGTDGHAPSSFTSDGGYDAEVNIVNGSTRSKSTITSTTNQTTDRSKPFTDANIVHSVPIQRQVPAKAFTPSIAPVNSANSFTQKQYQYRPGPKPFPNSPHIRKLSPTASVKYLQSKPFSTSYAYETPVEEYLRKTGGLFGTDPNVSKGATYFASETRRAIAEEENGFGRATSPAQSGSFKRISRAVGTPVS